MGLAMTASFGDFDTILPILELNAVHAPGLLEAPKA
jgi:hypothetical protein